MGQTVVATPEALYGLSATVRKDVIAAQDTVEFVARLSELLSARSNSLIGSNARRRVLSEYAWPQKLALLDRVLGLEESVAPTL